MESGSEFSDACLKSNGTESGTTTRKQSLTTNSTFPNGDLLIKIFLLILLKFQKFEFYFDKILATFLLSAACAAVASAFIYYLSFKESFLENNDNSK